MILKPLAACAILGLCVGIASADAPEFWKEDGKAVRDTDSKKTKDGFGAWLFLTEDKKFFDDWYKPETPHLSPTNMARRNVPVFASVIFAGAGNDGEGRTDVIYHLTIRKPDGSIYGEGDPEGSKEKSTAR